MKCLVFVKFLPGGSLSPEEFFGRLNAQCICFQREDDKLTEKTDSPKTVRTLRPRSAICVADYESIEQSAIDLAIMPGAGISNVEVVPISEETEHEYSWGNSSITGFGMFLAT